MDNNHIKPLLLQIGILTKHYEKVSELTGENFNVFRILKIENNEVRMHSAFIAELLNPKGCHGQNDLFLKLFLEILQINDFISQGAILEVEKNTGFINEDKTSGGRIDIIIKDIENKRIIIENKIYAGDQEYQLMRYHKYDPNAYLFYLTLFGALPSKVSTGGVLKNNSDYKIISYQETIIQWLDRCFKEAASHPILRETIAQYKNLIKYLTNQNINVTMNESIKEIILSSPEQFKSAELCSQAFLILKDEIHKKFSTEIARRLESITEPIMVWNNFVIDWHISEDSGGFYFGITAKRDNRNDLCKIEELKPLYELLRRINPEFKNSAWHIGWLNPKSVKHFNSLNSEIIYNLFKEEFFQSFIDDIFNEAKGYVAKFKRIVNEKVN